MLTIDRPGYERQLLIRDAVRTALTNDRDWAIEELRESFMAELRRMDDEQLAERVIRNSSADELKALYVSIGDEEDPEIDAELDMKYGGRCE